MKVVADVGARPTGRNSTPSGVGVARLAIERAEKRGISETAEC